MDMDKLIQIIAYILKKYEGELNYTKLIKSLYLIDREAISKKGFSITGDKYICMKYGPVLSNVYNFINDKGNAKQLSKWNCYFIKNGFNLRLITFAIPDGKLSRFEKGIIDDVDSRYHNYTYRQMISETHKCPEWKELNIKEGSVKLPKVAILKALGFDNNSIQAILEEDGIYTEERKIFDKVKTTI